MKKTLLVALFATAAAIVSAEAQTQSQSYAAPINKHKNLPKQAPTPTQARAIGAIPRAGRNPLQLLNPRAADRYFAPPQETVVYDTANYEANRHPQATGLILFGLGW